MIHPKLKHVYIGVDVHRFTHTGVVINAFFEKLGEITFENNSTGFNAFVDEVSKHLSEGVTPIFGLENVVDSGRELALFLIEKGHKVKYVNASLTYSERKNQSILQKTDSFDAQCVARILLSKLGELPDTMLSNNYWMISQLVEKRNDLVKATTSLKNQLHAYIIHHYKGYKKFFCDIDNGIALEFWAEYPSASKLDGVSLESLTEFLKKHSHGMCKEKTAKIILDSIAIDYTPINPFQDTRDYIVTLTVKQIKANKKTIEEVEKHIEELVPTFGYKLQTMKGINIVTAASLISEIGDINRFSNSSKLAKYAGISPVKFSSGVTDKNFSNRNGDRSLNRLFFLIAVRVTGVRGTKSNMIPLNEVFYNYYHKKISEGKTKKQSLKCVMRRLVNIIYGMMKNRTEYIHPISQK